MMTVAKAFVDTNVLLRAFLTQMDSDGETDSLIKQMLKENVELWISGQIIREFIVQATHPKTLTTPLTIDQVISEINTITQIFQIADETILVRAKLLELQPLGARKPPCLSRGMKALRVEG